MTQDMTEVPARDWFVNPPQRRQGVLVLLQRASEPDQFLVVTRPYKHGSWGLPGGSVAQDELARDALRRVTKAKLGLAVEPRQRVATDYVSKTQTIIEGFNEIFYGILPENHAIILGGGYGEHRWVTLSEANELLDDPQARRFKYSVEALDRGSTAELIHGRPAWSRSATA